MDRKDSLSICPAVSNAPSTGERKKKGREKRGNSRQEEEHMQRARRGKQYGSKNFGLFWVVLASADDLSLTRHFLDFIL